MGPVISALEARAATCHGCWASPEQGEGQRVLLPCLSLLLSSRGITMAVVSPVRVSHGCLFVVAMGPATGLGTAMIRAMLDPLTPPPDPFFYFSCGYLHLLPCFRPCCGGKLLWSTVVNHGSCFAPRGDALLPLCRSCLLCYMLGRCFAPRPSSSLGSCFSGEMICSHSLWLMLCSWRCFVPVGSIAFNRGVGGLSSLDCRFCCVPVCALKFVRFACCFG